MRAYDFEEIETKWQGVWEAQKAYKTPSPSEWKKPKYYILDMFPYPSGSGLHVGHPKGYTATDVIARYKRMQGFNVLHPIGWDAFGLPAERAAEREGQHPAIITARNIHNFKQQIKRLGFSYDWDREINTSDPDFYQWTQWIFIKLYQRGLAYLAEVPVNWCPALNTVLANEEVSNGRYIETGDLVEQRTMRQWMLKITAYADRLLQDLNEIDWPDNIKEMQRNWIGKSEGAIIRFRIQQADNQLEVFTTRPETLFGATYCVLSLEHPLLKHIISPSQQHSVMLYLQNARTKPHDTHEPLGKSGVFTGAYAIHPLNNTLLPIWLSDYVLSSYGQGAVMGVPAHDTRDHDFAQRFNLPIIHVIRPQNPETNHTDCYTGEGICQNSSFLDGLNSQDARELILKHLENSGHARRHTQYRLRDWLFSRQRYWGEPIPIIHSNNTHTHVPEHDLPVLLPSLEHTHKTHQSPDNSVGIPLAQAPNHWKNPQLKNGTQAHRELNTMPQWAGSCWYYLRYLHNKQAQEPWSKDEEKYWMPVDLYVGGVEHAVLHLLYARFWHKVLYDCGLVSTKEPFQKLFNQGMILAHSYQDEHGKYYHPHDIEKQSDQHLTKTTKIPVRIRIEKMSKSRYNVINPNEIVKKYGADTLRLYELFMGPLSDSAPWQTQGLDGIYRFLERTWRLIVHETGTLSDKISDAPPDEATKHLERTLHKAIKAVQESIESIDKLNTGISALMIFVNEAYKSSYLPRQVLKDFLLILSPYAPHIAEELWHYLGEESLIVHQIWPKYNELLTQDDTITIMIQINSRNCTTLTISRHTTPEQRTSLALSQEKVKAKLQNREIQRLIIIDNKLINILT